MATSHHSSCCAEMRHRRVPRRHLLKIGGLSFLGASLPQILAAEEASTHEPRVKSVLFYHHFGAPSHIDMFDPKPDAPADVRGEFATINTSAADIRVTDMMPRIAKICDRLCVIRSMAHLVAGHNPGTYLTLSGRHGDSVSQILGKTPEDWPALGSVVSQLKPTRPQVPSYVLLPYLAGDRGLVAPGQYGGRLGKQFDPLVIDRDPNRQNFWCLGIIASR